MKTLKTIDNLLTVYHESNPLKPGMIREEVRADYFLEIEAKTLCFNEYTVRMKCKN